MTADLQPIGIRPDVVGMVDCPRRQPENLGRQRGQQFEACGLDGHGDAPNRVSMHRF